MADWRIATDVAAEFIAARPRLSEQANIAEGDQVSGEQEGARRAAGQLSAEQEGTQRAAGQLSAKQQGARIAASQLSAEQEGTRRAAGQLSAKQEGDWSAAGQLSAEQVGARRAAGQLSAEQEGARRGASQLSAKQEGDWRAAGQLSAEQAGARRAASQLSAEQVGARKAADQLSADQVAARIRAARRGGPATIDTQADGTRRPAPDASLPESDEFGRGRPEELTGTGMPATRGTRLADGETIVIFGSRVLPLPSLPAAAEFGEVEAVVPNKGYGFIRWVPT
jgi:hypothetical protein